MTPSAAKKSKALSGSDASTRSGPGSSGWESTTPSSRWPESAAKWPPGCISSLSGSGAGRDEGAARGSASCMSREKICPSVAERSFAPCSRGCDCVVGSWRAKGSPMAGKSGDMIDSSVRAAPGRDGGRSTPRGGRALLASGSSATTGRAKDRCAGVPRPWPANRLVTVPRGAPSPPSAVCPGEKDWPREAPNDSGRRLSVRGHAGLSGSTAASAGKSDGWSSSLSPSLPWPGSSMSRANWREASFWAVSLSWPGKAAAGSLATIGCCSSMRMR